MPLLRNDETESLEDDSFRNVPVAPEVTQRLETFLGRPLRRGEQAKFYNQGADELMRRIMDQALEARRAGLPFLSVWAPVDPTRKSRNSSSRDDII